MYSSASSIGFAMMTAASAVLPWVLPGRAQAGDEDFQPIIEAEMPERFPAYTPVGEVRVKHYPAYRKAETGASRGSAFWTLFSHIKQNGVAMTAPVEMTYTDRRPSREATMAFLYGTADTGEAGRQGRVEVVDAPAITALSTGVRGPRTDDAVAKARARLDTWLENNGERYVSAGPMRVMAYNSPFIPRDRNYFEVEIPIRPLAADESGPDSHP